MWECKYGKEPADLKLLAIQFYRKIWIVLLSAFLGAIFSGTGYMIRNVVFAPEPSYEAQALLYVDFVESNEGGPKYYTFNTAGWSGFVKTDDMLDRAVAYLQKDQTAASFDRPIEKSEMRDGITASVDADYRVVELTVTNTNPERAVIISHAIEKGFLDFGKEMKEIEQIRIMTTADHADRIIVDTHTYRAFFWGAILASILVVLLLAMQTILDDSIYVPITFERRYGIPMLGAILTPKRPEERSRGEDSFQIARKEEIITNFQYLCKDERLALLTVDADKKERKTENTEDIVLDQFVKLPKINNLLRHPEEMKKLMEYEAVILEIPAGKHNGAIIEYTIAQAEKFNCKVIAGILKDADEGLLKTYYFGRLFRKGNKK